MENNHLTYFKIENFKKFDSLEVNDIGQFNLIVGDNNVGKTCLLEALLVDENIDVSIENMHNTLCRRTIHIHPENIQSKNPVFPKENYFNFLKHNASKKISFVWKTKQKTFDYSFEDKIVEELTEDDFKKESRHNYNVGRPNFWLKIYKEGVFNQLQFMYLDDFRTKFGHGYQPFIGKNAGFNYDINKYYAEEIGLRENEKLNVHSLDDITTKVKSLSSDEHEKFIKKLAVFFGDIEKLMIIDYFRRDILSLKLKRYNDFMPITYFGDGVNEYVRYLLEILKCKSKRIMIDEIGTGIHHSKMKDFWVNIIKLCEDLDVQLFATTHSKECSEAFVEAAKSLDTNIQSEIRLIELYESKGNVYSATVKEVDNIEYSVKNLPFRGENIYV